MAAPPPKLHSPLLYWKYESFCGYLYCERGSIGAAGWGGDYSRSSGSSIPSHGTVGGCWDGEWEIVSLDVNRLGMWIVMNDLGDLGKGAGVKLHDALGI